MDYLTIKETERKIGKNQTPRTYLDFIVSGKSLRETLDIVDDDLITPFGWSENAEYTQHILNVFRLKEKSPLVTGRVMLYVCPECGDIDCGAITAVITDLGNRIQWNHFGYENGYRGLAETYDHILPIEFERINYFETFAYVAKLITNHE